MPFERAVKPSVRIVNAVLQGVDCRAAIGAAFKIQRSDLHVAFSLRHSEKLGLRRGENDRVVLGNDVGENRKVGRVVKC